MSWPRMAQELDGFDPDTLRQLVLESGPAARSLDRDIWELCGVWTIALDYSIASRWEERPTPSTAREIAEELARLNGLMRALRELYDAYPPSADPDRLRAVLEQALAQAARWTPDQDWRRVDVVCWYLEAWGRPVEGLVEELIEELLDASNDDFLDTVALRISEEI